MFSQSLKFIPGGLLVAFVLVAISIVPFGGVPQVEAAIGTGCGDATGVVPTASVTATSVTDTSKNWKPINRWVGGVATITGTVGTTPTTVKIGAIAANTANTIGFPAINPFPVFVGNVTYTVTAKPTACKEGNVNYSCVQAGDAGFCKGPCNTDVMCEAFLVGGTSDIGWGGTKCTSTDALNPGSCLELPGSARRLGDTAPATTGEGLLLIVDTVTNWIFAVFVLLSIIFILLAAFQFITGGGDEAKINEARNKLIWAVVGIIIALLAKGLVPIVRSIVGG